MESFARMSLLRANWEVRTTIRARIMGGGLADSSVCDSSVLAKLDE